MKWDSTVGQGDSRGINSRELRQFSCGTGLVVGQVGKEKERGKDLRREMEREVTCEVGGMCGIVGGEREKGIGKRWKIALSKLRSHLNIHTP